MVFGKVLEGMEVVRRIENLKTDEGDHPGKEVVIVDSGVIAVDTPFDVDQSPTKDWIEITTLHRRFRSWNNTETYDNGERAGGQRQKKKTT